MAVINAEDMVLGRMATAVADRLLKGENIEIVNAEKAVIIGNPKSVFSRYKTRRDMSGKGHPEKGPKFPKAPDRIVKRTVRGMLPRNRERGRNALERLKVYVGTPRELEGKDVETIDGAKNKGLRKFMVLGNLGSALGSKR